MMKRSPRGFKLKMVSAAAALILSTTCLVMASGDDDKGTTLKPSQPIDQPATVVDTAVIDIQLVAKTKRDALASNQANEDSHIVSGPSTSSIESITVNGVTFRMIHVDGGTFTMGATEEQGSDAYSDETPPHDVYLSDFSIGETEVTQELWQAVMGYNPSQFIGLQRPVETVSWGDCQAFVYRLCELTGKRFRLPTEAEWEYAARGGKKSKGYKYAGSNDLNSVAWYDDNSQGTTHVVGTKQSNELGLYDMSGNVAEWCQDGYSKYDSYGNEVAINPWGSNDYIRMIRGGCFSYSSRFCRVSHRGRTLNYFRERSYGLRLTIREASSGQNISFMHEYQRAMTTQSSCTVPVPLKRGNTQGEYTAHVILDYPWCENASLQNLSVTFADGKDVAYAYINFYGMEFGCDYSCGLSLSETDAATTNPEYGTQILKTTIKIHRDNNWVSAGTCTFTDYTWEDGYSAVNVPIQNAKGTNIYRIVSPLAAVYDASYVDGEGDDTNFVFYLNDDGSISVDDGEQMDYWGYLFYWTSAYPNYCYVEQNGNTYAVNFLLLNGDSLYLGGYFVFTWYRNTTEVTAPESNVEVQPARPLGKPTKQFQPLTTNNK